MAGEGRGACLAACHKEKEDTSRVRELPREKQADTLECGLVRADPSPQFPRPLSLQMLHIKQDFTVNEECLLKFFLLNPPL